MTIWTQFLLDVFSLPSWGRGVWSVWYRNFLYFKNTIWISIFWVVVEPLVYLLAIGYGVGHFVGTIGSLSYDKFYFPALMATSGMFVSFFEGTYGSFTKLNKQNTFQTIVLTPISASEIAIAEILWATSKGLFSCVAIGLVGWSQGLAHPFMLLPCYLVMAFTCWIFASFGVLMSSYAKNYDMFVYAQSGFIIPMSLFSGTYFPVDQLPNQVQWISKMLPLSHAVESMRNILYFQINSSVILDLIILLLTGYLISNWATHRLSRKIVS